MSKSEVVRQFLRDNPSLAKRHAARMLAKQRPDLFPDGTEQARVFIRYVTGSNGSFCRPFVGGFQGIIDRLSKSRNPFDSAWGAVQLNGPLRALVISDVHVPYHDRSAVAAAIHHGRRCKVDTILINGDFIDCYAISNWHKDPRKRDFKGEVDAALNDLQLIRDSFPQAKIIFKFGNHEERFEFYMQRNAPDFLGFNEYRLETLLHMDDLGITAVKDKRRIRLGRLNVIHGHEYRFAIANPVSPARGLFLRAKAFALCGHFHQLSHHSEVTIEDQHISTWSTGCLCHLHFDWLPFNAWRHGFAIVTVEANGKFRVDNHLVSKGVVY